MSKQTPPIFLSEDLSDRYSPQKPHPKKKSRESKKRKDLRYIQSFQPPHHRFDPFTSQRKRNMPLGKLFNAVKRLVARIIKPYLAQKLEAPQYESAAQDPLHVQTGRYQNGEFPAYAEVGHFHQQSAQYSDAFQAPYRQFHQPGRVQSQQESHHHHQSRSSVQAPNTFGPDSLDAYSATYEDPGPPDGYIIPEFGRRIPFWWDPPRELVPRMYHRRSHW